MQGFERLAEFSRAVRASRSASAANCSPFTLYTDDLQFAEGMMFGVALVLPFWILVACAVGLILH
jgi:hypothetical protein